MFVSVVKRRGYGLPLVLRNVQPIRYESTKAANNSPVSKNEMNESKENEILRPVFPKKGNLLLNALNYVKEVDNYQKQLSQSGTSQDRATELITRIKDKKQLLYLLSIFHYELSKIGITNQDLDEFRNSILWRYRLNWLFKYNKIHNIFWESCQLENVSENNHSLGFNPISIGILDPRNFSTDTYKQLQSGKLGSVDFSDVQGITFSRPPYQR